MTTSAFVNKSYLLAVGADSSGYAGALANPPTMPLFSWLGSN